MAAKATELMVVFQSASLLPRYCCCQHHYSAVVDVAYSDKDASDEDGDAEDVNGDARRGWGADLRREWPTEGWETVCGDLFEFGDNG